VKTTSALGAGNIRGGSTRAVPPRWPPLCWPCELRRGQPHPCPPASTHTPPAEQLGSRDPPWVQAPRSSLRQGQQQPKLPPKPRPPAALASFRADGTFLGMLWGMGRAQHGAGAPLLEQRGWPRRASFQQPSHSAIVQWVKLQLKLPRLLLPTLMSHKDSQTASPWQVQRKVVEDLQREQWHSGAGDVG